MGRRHSSKLKSLIKKPDRSMSIELRWMCREEEEQKQKEEGEREMKERVSLQQAEHSPIYNAIKKQNPFPLTAASWQTLTWKELASGTQCEFNPLAPSRGGSSSPPGFDGRTAFLSSIREDSICMSVVGESSLCPLSGVKGKQNVPSVFRIVIDTVLLQPKQ